jgi:hypothetical protein
MTPQYRIVVAASMTLMLSAVPARAADDRAIAVGGGIGTVGSWFNPSPLSGADVRVSIPVGQRGDVEPIVAVQAPSHDETFGFYGAQYRHRLVTTNGARSAPFFTCGAVGIFYRERGDSMATPPLFTLAGIGFEQRVSRRLALRFDTQGIFLLVIPVGVRVAGGVSIPIGRLQPSGDHPQR